jgi:hypothetical protein
MVSKYQQKILGALKRIKMTNRKNKHTLREQLFIEIEKYLNANEVAALKLLPKLSKDKLLSIVIAEINPEIHTDNIFSKSRRNEYVVIRQLFTSVAYIFGYPIAEIAEYLERNNRTIIYSMELTISFGELKSKYIRVLYQLINYDNPRTVTIPISSLEFWVRISEMQIRKIGVLKKGFILPEFTEVINKIKKYM